MSSSPRSFVGVYCGRDSHNDAVRSCEICVSLPRPQPPAALAPAVSTLFLFVLPALPSAVEVWGTAACLSSSGSSPV
ncbi:hypothetical protein Pmani_026537 [Petrolisthes manimaculis]|uniref:Uncharacterized protein n=1 Tax=Petrolisthes manimaculis TaxID=1843537 RepID=A0AAE1TWJ5_9EUCA|nr:hypothetical protein Pmani_026537 [Petrolisthes manimaculis]